MTLNAEVVDGIREIVDALLHFRLVPLVEPQQVVETILSREASVGALDVNWSCTNNCTKY